MKFTGLGKRTKKLYLRNALIFVGGLIAWFLTILLFHYLELGAYAFWASLPFLLVSIVSWFGLIGYGPLKKGFKEAIESDKAEQSYSAKQPWEQ